MKKPIVIPLIKESGRFNEGIQMFKDLLMTFDDGYHEVHVFQNKKRVYHTRYKYYFAYCLPEIIRRCNIMIVEHRTGEQRLMTAEEIHEHLKRVYNGGTIIDPLTRKMTTLSLSTTDLTDSEFIGQFEDRIISDFIQEYPEEFQDFLLRSEWVEMQINSHENTTQ